MIQPKSIWEEYQRGKSYKTAIDLYETVRQNENFYIGKQWEGVNAPDLPKPVLNFLKRVVTYFTAMLVSDDIAISLRPYDPDPQVESTAKILSREIERVIEQTKAKTLNREAVKNAAVDGDACIYLWFDPDAETGQDAKGRIKMELVENTNVYFGNPHLHDVQNQPFIIIAQRKILSDVKREAKENKIPQAQIDLITPDSDSNQNEKGEDNQLVTVLVKLWRENGSIRAVKTTEKVVIKKEWDTEYKCYPIAYWSWEKIKSSYHGQAALTGLIQNQISVNRLFAMTIRSVEMNAFPKVVYDSNKFPNGWSNRVGEAIRASGNVNEAIMTAIRGADVSGQVMEVIDRIITMTRDFMGASDAALGNVKPDNTSAIIAVQQASAIPLELQRLALYQFVEDYVRIIVDIMRADYGERRVYTDPEDLSVEDVSGMEFEKGNLATYVDFSMLETANLELNVDVGAAAYWSEITQMQTADNLFKLGLIQDAVLYLESIPSRYVKNYNKIIDSLKQHQTAMQQQTQMQLNQMGQENTPQEEAPQGVF